VDVKATIVGGYGGMGQIISRLLKSEGCDVTITGPTKSKGVDVSSRLGVKYVRDNVAAASDADVVIITVPIVKTKETILEVAPHVKPGSAIMDLTSVKGWPCELMLSHSNEGVEVVGTHPVFGPRVGSVEGQVFVLTPVRGKKWHMWLKEILERNRARTIDSTPKEHDEVMAVVQGLTHYAYIGIGKTLKDMDFDVKRSRDFSSPVYDLMLDMAGRIIGQNPSLYAEIQLWNPEIPRVHEAYVRALKDLSDSVKEADEGCFVKMMSEAARHFDDTDRAMGRSDKAIESLVAELKFLKGSVGREICLRHIYSGTVHFGVVECVSADEVVLSDGGRKRKLKLSNLVILGGDDLIKYKAQKYGTVKRDYSFIFLDSADEKFIADVLLKKDADVVSAYVKDVFRGEKIGAGKKSVCFSVEYLNISLRERGDEIASFFSRIGGVPR
jgi:prephenate dehydrogenase